MSDRRNRGADDRDASRGEKRRRVEEDGHDPRSGHHATEAEPDAGNGAAEAQHEGGGQDLSLSVEETNKMRAALGLKPLKTGPSKAAERAGEEKKRHTDERQRKEREREADEHRARLEAQREKRKLEDKLQRTRKLSEAHDEEEEDMAAWVAKSRMAEQEQQRKAAEHMAKEAAAKSKVKAKARDSDSDNDYSATELAGMKVKHDFGELVEGETAILTLADRPILNEKGELNDDAGEEELENVLKAEDKKREKARRLATKKGKPLFGEDGKKQSLLDKYDEEEEIALRLDEAGGLEANQRRQEAVRQRLAAGTAILDSAVSAPAIPSATSGADFYTESEVAAFAKPKRKKKDRQLRRKPADEEEGGTASLMAQLEAEAEAEAAAAGPCKRADLGTRGEGQERQDRKAAEQDAIQKDKRARFDNALEKANWAAAALRPERRAAAAETLAGEDGADEELHESLARARRQAQQAAALREKAAGPASATLLEELAASTAARREAEEAHRREQLATGAEVYTEATEFVRNIGAEQSEDVGPSGTHPKAGTGAHGTAPSEANASAPGIKKEEDEGGYMGMDVDDNEQDRKDGTSGSKAEDVKLPPAKWGAWVTAEEAEQAAETSQQQEKTKQRIKLAKGEAAAAAADALADSSIITERAVGKGLSSVLALMHEKGDFSERNKVEWAGRTNDKKPVMLIGLEEVYQGGGHEERLARSIEAALTQRDVLGRVMTPKQRFREQCYRFHGIFPSKNQQEKKMRKEAEDVKSRQAATSENPSAELDRLQTIQRQTGKAHVVLSGKDALKPAALKPPSGLGGGITPVAGDRKVQMMLGMRKMPPADSSKDMPPPPPRKHA